MTNQEAIERIEAVQNSDYHFDETIGYQLTSDDFLWLEKAKSALKEQMEQLHMYEAFVQDLKDNPSELCATCLYSQILNENCNAECASCQQKCECENCLHFENYKWRGEHHG